ncbi:MAG: ribonuclease HI [Chloroherpetonaceae bacterium]
MKKAPSKPNVVVYTDGACEGNPGRGGYGVVMLWGEKRKEISGGFQRTTNNRMELLAVIEALAALKQPCNVKLYSDSNYVVNAMSEGWVESWRRKGWRNSQNKPTPNVDLWKRLLALCERHDVEFIWVKGHSGVEENERCDALAVAAAQQPNLPIDEGYTTRAGVS